MEGYGTKAKERCKYDKDHMACLECPFDDCIRDDILDDDFVLEVDMTIDEEVMKRFPGHRLMSEKEWRKQKKKIYWERLRGGKTKDEWREIDRLRHARWLQMVRENPEKYREYLARQRANGKRYRDRMTEEKRERRREYQRLYYQVCKGLRDLCK